MLLLEWFCLAAGVQPASEHMNLVISSPHSVSPTEGHDGHAASGVNVRFRSHGIGPGKERGHATLSVILMDLEDDLNLGHTCKSV